jgi:fermentation-respiration switch protein FrsA (DUF1100 family)
VGALVFLEHRLIFPVAPWTRRLEAPDPRLGLGPKRVTTMTRDGIRLVGWLMEGERGSDPWMLVFHGNAGNISSDGRPAHYARLRALGLNVVAFDYRGYGESEGQPTEAGLYLDAEAAYAFLRDSLGVAADRIILFGHSLGSAVAVDLASRVPARGLVVEGAFSSGPDVAQRTYWFVPVRRVMRSRFASDEKIGRVPGPKLFLHARRDEVIPLDLGRRLFERAHDPRAFVELAGGHSDAYLADSAGYFGALAAFLR